jgi:hypothetical protein
VKMPPQTGNLSKKRGVCRFSKRYIDSDIV